MSMPTPRQFKFTTLGVGLLIGPLVWAVWILSIYAGASAELVKTLALSTAVGVLHGAMTGFVVGRLRLGKIAGGIAGYGVPMALFFTIYFIGFFYELFVSSFDPARDNAKYPAVIGGIVIFWFYITLNILVPCVIVGMLTSAIAHFVALGIRWKRA